MSKKFAQQINTTPDGKRKIVDDWYNAALPDTVALGEMSYPDTAYSFVTFHGKQENSFELGYASGNYGHSNFTAGEQGVIRIGAFSILESTNLISNNLISIGSHCMFSWGSIITDSWLDQDSASVELRRNMLRAAAANENRHLEFCCPKPVLIEDNVWVGFGAVIMPGVRLGKNSIIGCKTIVTQDVPAYAVVAGNPARLIKYLPPDDTPEAKELAWQNLNPEPGV